MSTHPSSIVLIETWHAEATGARALNERLDGHRLVELPAPELRRGELFPRVSDWVGFHRAALRSSGVPPPYFLVGWSFGGVVAFELARQLMAEGVPVAHVVMIDSTRPRLKPLALRDAFRYHLFESTLIDDETRRREYLRTEVRRWVRRRVRPIVARARRSVSRKPPARPAKNAEPKDELTRSIWRSYLNYQCRPSDIPVTMFVTEQSVGNAHGDPSLRWSHYLRGGFRVVRIVGDHYSLWSPPHLDGLATMLSSEFDRSAETTAGV